MRLTSRTTLAAVATAVGDALRRKGIIAVLTGGACASLYTRGRHQSVDVDFVVTGPATGVHLDAALTPLGFERKGDRYVHPRVPFYVEFPRGPLAIGNDFRIRPVERRSRYGRTLALSATDSCRDRLAAFYHWNDRQSLRVATWIARRNRVSYRTIRQWSVAEGFDDGYREFLASVKRSGRR